MKKVSVQGVFKAIAVKLIIDRENEKLKHSFQEYRLLKDNSREKKESFHDVLWNNVESRTLKRSDGKISRRELRGRNHSRLLK